MSGSIEPLWKATGLTHFRNRGPEGKCGFSSVTQQAGSRWRTGPNSFYSSMQLPNPRAMTRGQLYRLTHLFRNSDIPHTSYPGRGGPRSDTSGCHPGPSLPLTPTSCWLPCSFGSASLINTSFNQLACSAHLQGWSKLPSLKEVTDPGWFPKDPATWTSASHSKHRTFPEATADSVPLWSAHIGHNFLENNVISFFNPFFFNLPWCFVFR